LYVMSVVGKQSRVGMGPSLGAMPIDTGSAGTEAFKHTKEPQVDKLCQLQASNLGANLSGICEGMDWAAMVCSLKP